MNNLFSNIKLYADFLEDSSANLSSKSNPKSILVVLPSEVSNKEKDLLAKILAAVKIDLNKEAAVVHITNNQNFSLSEFVIERKITKCLVFGLTPERLGINYQVAPYEPIAVNNIHYLLAATLDSIAANQNQKKMLWLGLKYIFD